MRNQKGFTLIEILLVVVILGIIATVAIPRLMAARNQTLAEKAKENLSQIANGEEGYYSSNFRFTVIDNLTFFPSDRYWKYEVRLSDNGDAFEAVATNGKKEFYCSNSDPLIRERTVESVESEE